MAEPEPREALGTPSAGPNAPSAGPNAEVTAWFEAIVDREAKNPEWQPYFLREDWGLPGQDARTRMMGFAGYLCYKECRSTGMITHEEIAARISDPDAHFSAIVRRGFDGFVTQMTGAAQKDET
jgi:hypothetical protein